MIEKHYRQSSDISHISRQLNCWSFRCSWSIACRRCSNYIFILDLTPGFNEMGKDSCKTRRETVSVWFWWPILEVDGSHSSRYLCGQHILEYVCIWADNCTLKCLPPGRDGLPWFGTHDMTDGQFLAKPLTEISCVDEYEDSLLKRSRSLYQYISSCYWHQPLWYRKVRISWLHKLLIYRKKWCNLNRKKTNKTICISWSKLNGLPLRRHPYTCSKEITI